MRTLAAACIQMCSSDTVADNIQAAAALITEAAQRGASLIVTPEMTSLMDRRPNAVLAKACTEEHDAALAAFQVLAAALGIHLLIGSLPIKIAPDRCVNRSYCIDKQGAIIARYDKLHLFDVQLSDGQIYHESALYQAGNSAVLAAVEDYTLGLSICYDLRFPALYRELACAGADILTVPAAFTQVTGQAHWHVLLRARAIETGCFVLAAAQGGQHADGRETYGHSLIVDPWGTVLAEAAGAEPGIITASLNLARVAEVRQQIPALQHGRFLSRL